MKKPDRIKLRQRAEIQLKKQQSDVGSLSSEIDIRKINYELQVHQIELEMQNKELMLAKIESDAAAKKSDAVAKKYTELYDFAPSGYFTLTKEGEITELNIHGAGLLSKERQKLLNARFGFFVTEDTKPIFNLFLDKVFEGKGKESCEVTLSVESKNSPTYVYITGHVAEIGEQCQISVVDITERKLLEELRRKKADKALKESEDKLQDSSLMLNEVTQNMFDMVTVFSNEGKVLYATPSYKRVFGYMPKIGEDVMEYVHPDDIENVLSTIAKFKETQVPQTHELRLRKADGNYIWAESISNVYKNKEGEIAGMITSTRDITERKNAEEKLKKFQLLLSSTIDSQKDTIIFSIDKNYNYLIFNKAHENAMKFAWNVDIKLGMNILDYIKSDDERLLAKKNYDRALKGESHSNIQVYGSINSAYYESFFNPIRDDNNEIIACAGLARNITQRMQTEEILKERELELKERNKELNGIYELTLLTDRFSNLEDIYYEFVNLVAPRSMQFPDKTVVLLEIKDKQYCNIDDFSLAKNKSYLTAPIIVFGKEIGNLLFTYTEDLPFIELFEQNLINEYARRISKITERIEARNELEESELKLSYFFNQSTAGAFFMMLDEPVFWNDSVDKEKVLDYMIEHLRISKVNQAMLEQYKTTEKDFIGITFKDFFAHDIEYGRGILIELLDKGELHIDTDERRNDGSQMWVLGDYTCMYDSQGRITELFGFQIDITDRKKAEDTLLESEEKLIQLNADKDRFISILGHDLKNPFSNVLGFSELLTKDIRNYDIDKIEKIATNIYTSAQITNNLLEDILMWARSQQGSIVIKPQSLSLTDVCNEVLKTLEPDADVKSIAINFIAEHPINVYADADMLKTVLRNLVSNAIKFTSNGGSVDIKAEQDSENITIGVSDNGVGIPPENLEKLFDISEVQTTEGTSGESGTGLGLLICKEFLEKHGGRIWAESEQGKGSEFRFTLPNNYNQEI